MRRQSIRSYLRMNYDMYLLLLPGLLFIALFHYLPMYGITLAFRDFQIFADPNPILAIAKSPWVGLKHLARLFTGFEFPRVLRNTLVISLYKIVLLFPAPILLAILLNEVGSIYYKKVLQTVIYVPHFISWAIVSGIFVTLLGSTGVVNNLIHSLGGHTVAFLTDKRIFRTVLVVSDGWKEVGWSSIIYLAAITGIDPSLYEAAEVDGASKFRRILHITLPGIAPTIVMLLILRVGRVLDAGFEQIFIMYNPMVYEVADIIGTYVYRKGLGQMDFSFGTAVGLFNSVVAFVLVVGSNAVSRAFLGKSIW